MLLHLIKKDVLIIKKYVLIMLPIVIAIPPFISWWSPQVSPMVAFLISTIFAEFILCQYILLKENTYPKAAALLCAAPYPRSALVKARYAFFIVVFIACYAIYSVEAIFIPALAPLSILSVLGIFAFISLIYGIYMPVQYKLGYEKTKFFFMIIILTSPFILPSVIQSNGFSHLSFVMDIPEAIQWFALAALTVLIFVISTGISIRIYAKKELL